MAYARACYAIFVLFVLTVEAKHHSEDHEETIHIPLPAAETLQYDHYSNDTATDDRNVSKRSIDYQFVRSQASLSSSGWGICDSYLADGEGNITSHNYPFNYPDGVNCAYSIPRVDWASCSLELSFHDFDVRGDETIHCQDGDYLLVNNRRFCGRFAPGRKEIVHFPAKEKEAILSFHSNNYESGRGFWIEVRRLWGTCPQDRSGLLSAYNRRVTEAPLCDFCVRHTEGRVTSYGYPDNYKSNLNCTYRIERQPGHCAVELDFVDFLLEDSERCSKDFVTFDGIRYCSNTLLECRNVVDFHGKSELVIPFITDSYGNSRGFDIRFRQITCSSTPVPNWSVARKVPSESSYCNENLSAYQFYLRSPGHPKFYDSDLDCKYTVSRASVDVCELELTFLRFDLEHDRLCRGDFLDVNGEKLCGHLPAGTVRRLRFYGSQVQLHFHSDDTVSRPGFEILIKQKVDCSASTDARILPYNTGQSSAYCDAVHSSLEFYIQSMDFPREYGNLADCAYTVQKYSPSVCELQLTFLTFQLEDDPECRFDYLEIDGRKTCGTVRHGTIRRIPFDEAQLLLRFHSDRSTTRPGFQIFVQQRRDCHSEYTIPVPAPVLKPLCDHVYTIREFSLRSPNFPSTYSTNCQCIYRILRASEDVCELELRFHSFDVEDDVGCRYDYLDLDGQKVCGSLPSGFIRTLKFNRPEMVFNFHADHSITRQGFDITVRQKTDCGVRKPAVVYLPKPTPPPVTIYKQPILPVAIVEPKINVIHVPSTYIEWPTLPTSSCDHVFTTWEFYMQSVHFPLNYGNNVACTYRALRYSLSVCAWELHFMSFDVEASAGCQNDYLEANGERFCGPIAPGTVRRYLFDGPEFVLRFKSDSQTSGLGFYVLVRQITQCSANYAAAPLVSTYESFDAELRRHGGYVKGTMRRPMPTVVVPPGVPPPPLPPSPKCDFYMTQPSSQFTSGHYPSTYNQGLSCTYRIARAKDTCAIELYFYDFDVESSPDCAKDYLELGGKKFCGSELIGQTRMVHFDNKDEISFRFMTDGSGSSRGWWVYYRQVTCSEVNPATEVAVEGLCDNSFCDELGFIRSHNYPLSTYSSDEDCFYRIKKYRPEICTVQLSFTDFALEDSVDCSRDYLEINRVRYCGNQLRGKSVYIEFPPGSDEITMWFKTDGDKQSNGFFIQARQLAYGCDRRSEESLKAESLISRDIGTTCHQVSDDETGTFTTPEYPLSYPPNLDCTYAVKRHNAAVCGIELKFVEFSLETSRLCAYDYFQVPSEDRLCGNSWTGISRVIPFPSTESILEFFFHSDSRVQDRGFIIHWKQLTNNCP